MSIRTSMLTRCPYRPSMRSHRLHPLLVLPLLLGFSPRPQESAPAPKAGEVRPPLERKERIVGTILGAGDRGIHGAQVKAFKTRKSKKTDVRGRLSLRGSFEPWLILVATLPDGVHRACALPTRDDATGERHEFTWRIEEAFAPRRAPVSDPAADLKLARKLLIPIFEAEDKAGSEGLMFESIHGFARLNPRLAFQMGAAGGLPGDFLNSYALEVALEVLAASAPAEALELMEELEPEQVDHRILLKLARALDGDAAKAVLEAQAPGVLERAKPARRPDMAAQLAMGLRRAGDLEGANALLDQALALVKENEDEEVSSYTGQMLGLALVERDLDEALAWLEYVDPRQRPDLLGEVAARTAAQHPEKAAALAREIVDSRSTRSIVKWIPRIVHELAPVDAEVAMELAETSDPSGYGLAVFAHALREELDEESITELLAGALARYFDPKSTFRILNMEGDMIAGAILEIAHELDPDHFEDHLGLALATYRSTAGDQVNEDMDWVAECELALFLLDLDADIAAVFIESACEAYQAHSRGPRKDARMTGEESLWACLLRLDPKRALAIAKETDWKAEPILGTLLTIPPAERRAFVRTHYRRLWMPGD